MANSGLNYIIKVQMDQLADLNRLHDTIVAIQQLSQKGAEFNVRVNEQSLNSLTNEIATSVSRGFSRAGVKAGAGTGPTVSVDTAKLESSIQKLGEIVNNMGRVTTAATGSAPAATPITGPTSRVNVSAVDARIREIQQAMSDLQAYMQKTLDLNAEQVKRITRSARGVNWNTEGEQALYDRMNARLTALGQIRERAAVAAPPGSSGSYAGSSSGRGIAIDASILDRAFETGAQRLTDALRKGIEDATSGLSNAIVQAVNNALANTGGQGYRPVTEAEAAATLKTMAPYISQQQLAATQGALLNQPGGIQAGAARKAAQYMGGVASRDAGLIAYAASGGVMALPEQWRALMTGRVRNTGEVRRIEETIAGLIQRRGQAQDAGRADVAAQIQANIDEQLIRKNQAVFAALNKQIESATKQYQAVLATRFGRQEMTPDEYKRATGALQFSQERMESLRSKNPNLEREMLLLPDALAQYMRTTITRYVEQVRRFAQTNQPIDQSLMDEIRSSDLLSNLVGGVPKDARQARGTAYRMGNFLQQFGAAKTAYEFIRGRAQLGIPAFNPNLDVDTAPFLEGTEDPGRRPREERERYLRAFLQRGGAFAAQTEERRAYAERELRKMQEQMAAGQLGEAGQRRLLEYQREMEFGGRYYYSQSPFARGGLINNGALLAPMVRDPNDPAWMSGQQGRYLFDEAGRVARGEARSAVVGNPLAALGAELSADAKAARDLYQAMGYVEGALTRVNKTMAELSKVSFDPMVKEFQRLAEVMKPYAEIMSKVRASMAATGGSTVDAAKIATARERARAIEEERTKGLIDRQQLSAGRVRPLELEGVGRVARGYAPFSRDSNELLEAVTRAQAQLGRAENRQFDLNALFRAQIGAGIDPSGTGRAIGRSQAGYDALMGSLAINMRELTRQNPLLFGGATGELRSQAAGVIRADALRRVTSENLLQLQQAEAERKAAELQLETLRKNGAADTPGGQRQIARAEESIRAAQTRMSERFDFMQSRGLLPQGADARSIDAVLTRYRQLNAEFAKLADSFRKVSGEAIDAANNMTTFEKATNNVVAKFRNLSAYVFAGGIVYGIASQLRQAASAAVALEADLKRIQGVLPSRSASQAGVVGQGIVQGAMDYGIDLRTATQTGKLFAQTGASPQQTVELTRAALAAQVGAGIEAGQATELLIAVENITDRQVSAQNILDRISRIESQYAVTAQDLSNAIQRAGSLATQLQPQAIGAVDALDLIIGASTTIIERTRVSGEQAATALRFVLSRLSAPEVATQLQEQFGIKLAGDSPEQLRPLQDILADISARYNELRSSGQTVRAQQLLTTFAGARQSNVGAALLTEFDKVMRVAGESAMAYGDTQARVNLQLETTQARLNQFNTAFAAFAASVFNDTGLAGLFRGAVGASTTLLELGQRPETGFPTGLALLAAGGVMRAGSNALLNSAAAQLPRQALTTTAGLANVGARGVGTALSSGASASIWIGVIMALLAAVEKIAEEVKEAGDRRDISTQDKFDRRQFNDSELAKTTRELATGYGYGTKEFTSTINEALVRAYQNVDAQADRGGIPRNQVYNRTLEQFREQLDNQLPGFRSLGTEAQRTAEALSLLQTSIRYTNAIPQTFEVTLQKDLDNLFGKYDENVGMLGRMLRAGGRRNPYEGIENAFQSESGLRWLNFRQLRMPNMDEPNLAQFAGQRYGGMEDRRSFLTALDEYARTQLYLSGQQQTQLARLEASARVRLNLNPSAPISRAQMLEQVPLVRGLTVDDQAQLTGAVGRLYNQKALADSIASQIQTAIGNDRGQRVRALQNEVDASDGGTVGDLFVASLRQAIERAREKVESDIRRGMQDASSGREVVRVMNELRGQMNRVAQNANLAVTAVSVRDRIMEPIIGYGANLSEISAQRRVASQFGLSYDEVQARAQAAQQTLISLQTVPSKIAADMARTGAKIVAGGTEGMFFQAASAPEEGGRVDRTTTGARVAGDLFQQYVLGQRNALRQLDAMAAQYQMSMQEGLGGFIAAGMASDNEVLRRAATSLNENLTRLNNTVALSGDTEQARADKLTQLAAVQGDFNTQIAEYSRILGTEIIPLQERINQLAALERNEAVNRLKISLTGGTRGETSAIGLRGQALLQAQLLQQQLDPRRALQALGTQQQLIADQANIRKLTAEASAVKQEQEARLSLTGDALTNRLRDIQVTLYTETVAAQSEQLSQQLALVSQALASDRARSREEAKQLLANVMEPVRNLLMSPRNFNAEGYQQLIEGVAQAFQQRLVDRFLNSVLGETGAMGGAIISAFDSGALSTQTAIEAGFRNALVELEARLRQALAAPLPTPTSGTTVTIPPADDVAMAPGYGKRLLIDGNNILALNNKDAVLAGPKLVSYPANDVMSYGGRTQLLPFGTIDPTKLYDPTKPINPRNPVMLPPVVITGEQGAWDRWGRDVVSMTPFVGDAMQVSDGIQQALAGQYGAATASFGLAGLGLLPTGWLSKLGRLGRFLSRAPKTTSVLDNLADEAGALNKAFPSPAVITRNPGIEIFHGSPSVFRRPDLAHSLMGEGAQVRGRAFYGTNSVYEADRKYRMSGVRFLTENGIEAPILRYSSYVNNVPSLRIANAALEDAARIGIGRHDWSRMVPRTTGYEESARFAETAREQLRLLQNNPVATNLNDFSRLRGVFSGTAFADKYNPELLESAARSIINRRPLSNVQTNAARMWWSPGATYRFSADVDLDRALDLNTSIFEQGGLTARMIKSPQTAEMSELLESYARYDKTLSDFNRAVGSNVLQSSSSLRSLTTSGQAIVTRLEGKYGAVRTNEILQAEGFQLSRYRPFHGDYNPNKALRINSGDLIHSMILDPSRLTMRDRWIGGQGIPWPVKDIAMGAGSGRVITGPEGAFQLAPGDSILAGTDIFRTLNAQIEQLRQLGAAFAGLSQVLVNEDLTNLTTQLDTQVNALARTGQQGGAGYGAMAAGGDPTKPRGWRAAGEAALPLIGTYIGANQGGKDTYSAEGASILSGLGQVALGPVGGLIGGVIGGVLGGLFDKPQPPEPQQLAALQNIDRNTAQQIEAVENQTRLFSLDSRFLNVPTGFTVPGFRPFASGGAGMGAQVSISVYGAPGQSEQAIAQQVALALQQQLRGFGTSYDLRN